MISLIIDLFVGRWIAKSVKNLFFARIVAIATGVGNSIAVGLITGLIFEERPGAIMTRIAVGCFWHPIITLIAAAVYRRRLQRTSEDSDNVTEKNN